MEGNLNKAVGIDLGTTFSCIAIINDEGLPEIIPNAEGNRLTPSVVFFDEGISVVGEIAKENAELHADKVVMFVKREMGNTNWHYKQSPSQILSPSDISAIILKKIKNDAESFLESKIDYAVITVPAYFNDERRRSVLAAGEIAGFNVLQLINEPTAAAIAFGLQESMQDETALVYDLGGGTFDITLLKIEDQGKSIKIIASDGDHQLGGKDFDDAIIRICVDIFKGEHGFDPTEDLNDLQRLRKDAEKAKIELSDREKIALLVRSKGQRSRITIERNHFEQAIKSKIDTTLALIRSVLRTTKIKPESVNRVILIGGSTRIPMVREALYNFFGKEADTSVNPDEAVSIGAAILASKKMLDLSPDEQVNKEFIEKFGGLKITDVISHTIGIEAYVPGSDRKINSHLIKKNSPIPVEVTKEFVTNIHGQTAIKVTIYQGEFSEPSLCNPIGDFILKGLPPDRPPGCKVRLSVSCTDNGVIEVSATDIESGIETQTHVNYAMGQSKDQVSAKKLWMKEQIVE